MSVLSDQVYFFYILLAEAVQLLVSSLADDSSVVREASMASLRDIASLYVLFISFYFVHKTCNYEYREIFDTELLCDFFFFFYLGIRFWYLIVAMLCLVEDEG